MMIGIYLGMGFVTGFCSGLLGVGGGFVLIPLLLMAGSPMDVAVSASLVFVFCSAASGALRHGLQGTVDVPLAAAAAGASAITAFCGSLLTPRLPAASLQALLGLCVLGGLVLINRKLKLPIKAVSPRPGERWSWSHVFRWGNSLKHSVKLKHGLLVGGTVGFLAGLLGIGGGFLMVPVFTGMIGIELRTAIGTVVVTMLASSTVGALTHWSQGSMDATVVWTTAVGGIIGAHLGASRVPRLGEPLLKILLNVLLVFAGGYLLFRSGGLIP